MSYNVLPRNYGDMKPCPFCGSHDVEVWVDFDYYAFEGAYDGQHVSTRLRVRCQNVECGATGPVVYNSELKGSPYEELKRFQRYAAVVAAEAWNKRVEVAP